MTDREHDQLLATATEHFERRLSEEMGAVRVTMVERDSAIVNEMAGLRLEMAEQDAATRQEIVKEIAGLRVEMSEQDGATRREIAKQIGGLRLEMSERFAESLVRTESRHRELLKWAFVFWVGQAAAVAGIVSAFT